MLVLSGSANRSYEGPLNPAHFLDSSFHLHKRAWAPVIVPQPVEFKLLTTDGFP